VAGYWVKRLDEIPLVPTDDPGDFDWYPLQHHLGLSAFGLNAFRGDVGAPLVAEHDERGSGQEEVYVVVAGSARFTLAGESFEAAAISVVAITDPAVTRAAVATVAETIVLAVGAPAASGFSSTWNEANFEQVPRAD
jgi:hypothetical protein